MARQPIQAGRFYKEDFAKLETELKECFTGKLGPGDLPANRDESKKIRAIIAPHAGYVYSGQCAAWAYQAIAESHFPKTYILLGPNHQGTGSSLSLEDWKTPFGIIKNNKDLTRKIHETTGLKIDESCHNNEHSIEVQLPFLQFISKDKMKELQIVPITISEDLKITEFANNLKKILEDEDAVIIVSSDFTHYGRAYGYIPFEGEPQKRIKEMDKKSIEYIKNNQLKELLDHIDETQSTICGIIPIIILMQTLKEYKATLEMFYTSAEISGDVKNSVSYASIIFK
ncbi:AmmeMemoRadiSam system protein B [Candidatus Woesearchaeota archaeon]|nr:MAG: AmmeMemoRadiSam system protein B [Candidatus Woesearchaeota archaeon]